MNKTWFLVYTKARAEKACTVRLEKLGFEIFCPVQKVLKQWSDRKKWVTEPILSSYLFVKCLETERAKILQDPGVVKFIHWQSKPVIVKDSELLKFQEYLNGSGLLDVSLINIHPGDKTRIISGPFRGLDAEVLEAQSKIIMVRLEGNSSSMALLIQPHELEKRTN